MTDASVLYYPWGDARWRPFATLGFGVVGFHFQDRSGQGFDQTIVHLPIGLGLKYKWQPIFAFRLDLKDNLAFGTSRLDTMHNWSLTCGVELRWGGDSSKRYFPW